MWIAEIIPSQGFLSDNLAPRAGASVMMDDAALWVVDVAVVAVAAMWETFATPVAAVGIVKRDVKGIHAALRTTVVVQEEDVADQGRTVPSPTVVAGVAKMARSAPLEAQPVVVVVVVVVAAAEMSLLLVIPGSSIVDITATDPRITYRGSWQSVASSCNSSSQSRMATEPFSSFSLDFQGNAVYLSLSSNNARYTVTVGGRTTTFGGFESLVIPSNCSLSFEQAGLPTQSNTIQVTVSGSSLDSSLADDQWSFALDKIVVASTDPAVTSSARAAQSTVTGLSDNSAPALKWASIRLATGVAVVSVFFLF
ncbi:hypothetical protein PC9H_004737 [Pleurotus ostreatus]|uniref:Uncharacterized protein n=1 Tax=Pleurotus ostreatus TaxID=5322 RepID=A0A8H6ZXT3_PLEOS|nr:uncharacterized protein PC9H_004737 [Pleurotus ostreatus]KAF7432794.1 hypothetical protein PC9H_004737 [Pleurotus ostreatus]